jgi:hypothetical protein
MALPTVKLARKTVELYPDMQVSDEVEAALDALDAARKALQQETDSPSRTLASKAMTAAKKAVSEAEKVAEEVEARAKASVLEIVIHQMPKKLWREFQAEHPARDDKPLDTFFAVNWDEFVGAYLATVAPDLGPVEVRWQASGEPVEVIPNEWPAWVETISDPEYQKLAFAIGGLNSKPSSRPF